MDRQSKRTRQSCPRSTRRSSPRISKAFATKESTPVPPTFAPPDLTRARPVAGTPRPKADEPCHDTLTITDPLAPPRSRYCAHEVRTSQAEGRGFETRLPLHFPVSARHDTISVRVRQRP